MKLLQNIIAGLLFVSVTMHCMNPNTNMIPDRLKNPTFLFFAGTLASATLYYIASEKAIQRAIVKDNEMTRSTNQIDSVNKLISLRKQLLTTKCPNYLTKFHFDQITKRRIENINHMIDFYMAPNESGQ